MRQNLDTFTTAYIEAIEFTEVHSDNPEMQAADAFSDEFYTACADDCSAFQEANADTLAEACAVDGYSIEQAGHDYWLTRNGHGAGFWDRGLGAVGKKLTDAAHADGGRDAYTGDDNLIYLS